ncbi:Putative GTP cyclohydrolase 1 type 2, NIF3 family [Desulfonispora thiosulfatigenes DSM 11270]|uniref:Putative GTP cyclohydrolase 1 type 2, NIF3 family n=1 Tax=Desulfonispora thiosulfatigenes DSM 11270 TaxID=656914 RepID=A0A1W1VRI3_DESTI|nr:NGG1p interacting factor NIF3 [Desulfonispora thiosulfatigenes]SMB95969.1 Putative GTP cyclohydrolase 1 type 2, NIF3 family [Desulfonispora thiosulfatigenes DSM 11270]
MNIKDIYHLLIEKGKSVDPRGNNIEKLLQEETQKYNSLTEKEKMYFDQEKLFNPYSDTRILFGDENKEIKTVLAGIDIETSEMILADRLNEKGANIDLIIAHHPEGKALANLNEVMNIQEDLLCKLGIPINVAEGILDSRISEVKRSLLPLNHNRTIDAAKLLNIPLMCCHTPADNLVQAYLENIFAKENPEILEDVINVLLSIKEYQEAKYMGIGPEIIVGSEKRKVGKILVDMTGGTSGPDNVYEKLSLAGVGTIVSMHMGDKHKKEAEKYHINVIIAGHMASDSLGMNLILDEIEKCGVNIIPCSGLMRIKR